MKKILSAINWARRFLGSFPLIERAFAAIVLGPLGLSLAGVKPAGLEEAAPWWFGACCLVFGALTLPAISPRSEDA